MRGAGTQPERRPGSRNGAEAAWAASEKMRHSGRKAVNPGGLGAEPPMQQGVQ